MTTNDTDRRTDSARLPQPRRHPRDSDVEPLPGEPALWAVAPLRSDGRRSLRDWPDDVCTRLVRHYLPLTIRLVRRHATVLAYDLPADEVESQAAEWLLNALRRYDPSLGPSFPAYLATMLTRWVHDVARANTGRYVNDSKITISRVRERCLAEHHHEPTRQELVQAFGGDRYGAARRLRAVAVNDGLHGSLPLDGIDLNTVAVHADGGLWVYGQPDDNTEPDQQLLHRDTQRSATEAIARATWNGDGIDRHADNTAGLWSFVLTEFDHHTRQSLAAAAGCHPRRITAAINALLEGARARLTEAENHLRTG